MFANHTLIALLIVCFEIKGRMALYEGVKASIIKVGIAVIMPNIKGKKMLEGLIANSGFLWVNPELVHQWNYISFALFKICLQYLTHLVMVLLSDVNE